MKNQKINRRYQPAEIALWGPSQAGKDWLIAGFIKELETINKVDKNYRYELMESILGGQTGYISKQKKSSLPTNSPTLDLIDLLYDFYRKPINYQNLSNPPIRHQIMIHNNAGDKLVKCLNNRIEYRRAFLSLENAGSIILVLAPPVEKENSKGSIVATENNVAELIQISSEKAKHSFETTAGSNWTKETYYSFLSIFFEKIESFSVRNLVICMTKSDELGYVGNDFERIFKLRYGKNTFELVKSIMHSNKYKMKIIASTAAGFYQAEDNAWVPNIKDGKILFEDKWTPINTAAPFFWIFERIEEERRHNSRGNIHAPISYPQPRIIR